jgi:hypothetical protein
MKGKEIIEHIVRGEIPDMEQNMEQIRANCLSQEVNENSAKNKFPQKTDKVRLILWKPAAIIALMICFVMLASATAVIIYQTQYIPSKGFVEGDYEIYYAPEVLKFENLATVETITRVKDGKSSELSIIITDMLDKNIKITTEKHGEFNLTPVQDYNYSSYGTLGKFQFNNEGDYSSYGYFIENFPDVNEFTLVNNGESIEVNLVKSNSNDVLTAEDSGVTMRFYNMSKGSKVLAYEISGNNIDLGKIFGYGSIEVNGQIYKMAYGTNLELGPGTQAFRLYDENGNKIFLNGYDHSKGPDGLSTVMFLRTGRDEKISKMEVDYIGGSINPVNPAITSIGDIPVPADGEEIIFDDGLLLYDSNGLISKLTYIKREGNNILVYTDTEYIGEDIENIDIYINWNGILGSRMGGWTGNTWFEINGDEEFIKLYINAIYYKINGNWEINFN